MTNRRKKPEVSIWSIKHAEAIGIAGEIKHKKDNILPFVTLIMRKDIKSLTNEYLKYCDKKYPGDKLSSDDWISSFSKEWNELMKQEEANNLFLHRLNGVPDKKNWNGTFEETKEKE